MEIVWIGVAGWLAIGALGSALALEFLMRRSFGLDVTTRDIWFGAFMSILGPGNLIVGIFFFLGWAIGACSKAAGLYGDKVIFKAKGR